MKTLAWLGVLAIAILVAGGPPALAAPDAKGGFSVKVDNTTVRSGQTLTATGRYSAACAWIIDWNSERRSATAKRIVATFVAPAVTEPTRIPLTGTCFYDTRSPTRPRPSRPPLQPNGISQHLTVAVPRNWPQTISITVLPAGAVVSPPESGGGGGDLPNTGGPDVWILLAGIATLLAGASLIRITAPEALSR